MHSCNIKRVLTLINNEGLVHQQQEDRATAVAGVSPSDPADLEEIRQTGNIRILQKFRVFLVENNGWFLAAAS